MVCDRCKSAVEGILRDKDYNVLSMELGIVDIENDLSAAEINDLKDKLTAIGFELLEDKKAIIVQKIKDLIVKNIHYTDINLPVTLSSFLSKELQQDYNTVSQYFSQQEGTTIEKYFIAQKIEKIKELLVYNELTLSQIADKMHFSSVAYLSNQFKKETGMTASEYKAASDHKRQSLDKL